MNENLTGGDAFVPEILYTIEEAAPLLGYAPTTLRDRVTAKTVPCLFLHERTGVRFTADDLREIRLTMRRRRAVRPQAQKPADPDLSRFDSLRASQSPDR